jgi:hypothetical protein
MQMAPIWCNSQMMNSTTGSLIGNGAEGTLAEIQSNLKVIEAYLGRGAATWKAVPPRAQPPRLG